MALHPCFQPASPQLPTPLSYIYKHYGLSRFFVYMHSINIFLSHCPWQIYQIISFFSLYYFPFSRLFVCVVVFGCLSLDASYSCPFLLSGWWCKYRFLCISIEYVSFYNAFRTLDAKCHLRSFLCVADERQRALYYINVLCHGRAAMLVGILL